jgi:hypothetical protein
MCRREAVWFAVVSVGVVVAYAWSGQFWVDQVDEGYFLDLGQRVLDGQLPYRDFTTYYTPGIFYLFALAFKLFGISALPIRLLMVALRGACAVLLYVLTRRLTPWPLAWLPFGIVAALDQWPIATEPHPSWPSITACLLTLYLLMKHLDSGRIRWLALAGGSAGVAYFFKQNIGAFTAIGVAGYVLLRPSAGAAVWLRATQGLFVVGTIALITLVMRQGLNELAIGSLWLPVVVTLALLGFRAVSARAATACNKPVLEATVAATAFGVVTALWLVPLVLAVGPAQTPIGLFVGDVNQAAIASPFAAFSGGVRPFLLAAIWVPTLLLFRPRNGSRWLLAAAAGLSLIVLALPTWQGPRDPVSFDPLFVPIADWFDDSLGTLHLYLPALAAWAGIAGLIALRNTAGPFPWYVLFGSLAALTMYPRPDTLHAVVSIPPVLVAGTAALALVWHYVKTEPTWRRIGVLGTLLLVPIAGVAPQVVWRVATIVTPDNSAQRLDYVALGLPRAPLLLARRTTEDLRNVVEYIQANTSAGEPLFVYPVAPLFNFLADRPNPTRFDHFIPGTLTPDDLQQTVDELQQARPRYVVWDHYGALVWKTDPDNRVLSDYLWSCYQEVAAFRLYLVLERRDDACQI